MIKRLFLITALLISVTSLLHAGTRGIPTGKGDQLASADYGGVDVSTTSLLFFSSANVLIFSGEGVFQGVYIDSFTTSEVGTKLMVRDTENVVNAVNSYETTDDKWIITLGTATSTNLYNPEFVLENGAGAGYQNYLWKPSFPLKVNRGLVFKCSVGTIKRIRVLFTKFE